LSIVCNPCHNFLFSVLFPLLLGSLCILLPNNSPFLFQCSTCCFQHKDNHTQFFSGIENMGFGVDLMIVDILEGSPVPHLFIPTTMIPDWNNLEPRFLDTIFEFVSFHVHNVGAMLLFHADDLKIKTGLKEFMKAYDFSVFREWMSLASPAWVPCKRDAFFVGFSFTLL
jgi:hypothetical protein